VKRYSRVADTILSGLETISLREFCSGHKTGVNVVLVGWNPEESYRSQLYIDEELKSLGDKTCVLVVNNPAMGLDHFRTGPLWRVVRGTNTDGEFSGYDEGYAALGNSFTQPVTIFCNDRMLSYSEAATKEPLFPLVNAVAQNSVVVGHIDRISPELNGPSAYYLRTNFLIVPRKVKEELGSFISADATILKQAVPEDFPGESWIPGGLDPRYFCHLKLWLTEPTGWYRAQPLSHEYWPTFRRKLLAILNEHLLSKRLLDLNITLTDGRRARQLAALGRRPATRYRLKELLHDHPEMSLGYSSPGKRSRYLMSMGVILGRLGWTSVAVRLIKGSVAVEYPLDG
jgi:hypothetical protein